MGRGGLHSAWGRMGQQQACMADGHRRFACDRPNAKHTCIPTTCTGLAPPCTGLLPLVATLCARTRALVAPSSAAASRLMSAAARPPAARLLLRSAARPPPSANAIASPCGACVAGRGVRVSVLALLARLHASGCDRERRCMQPHQGSGRAAFKQQHSSSLRTMTLLPAPLGPTTQTRPGASGPTVALPRYDLKPFARTGLGCWVVVVVVVVVGGLCLPPGGSSSAWAAEAAAARTARCARQRQRRRRRLPTACRALHMHAEIAEDAHVRSLCSLS